jgi:glucose dehydrogenase
MTRLPFVAFLIVAGTFAVQGPSPSRDLTAQAGQGPTVVSWPLSNQDLAGTRFSPTKQISRSNVQTLTPRWLFQHGVIDGVSNQTHRSS